MNAYTGQTSLYKLISTSQFVSLIFGKGVEAMKIDFEERLLRRHSGPLHINMAIPRLVETAIIRGEGVLSATGALRVSTGKYTGRSPNDKYIVDTPDVHHDIWWENNLRISEAAFDGLLQKTVDYLDSRELFVFEGFAGADAAHTLPVRIINEYAWQNIFVQQLFLRAHDTGWMFPTVPGFTVIAAPGVKAVPERDGTNSEAFVIVNFPRKIVLIGGTQYAGEIKKSVFSVLNYLLPKQGILSMHCSANQGSKNDVSLFFGLSGTGKTSLSADPDRFLIGDDEHGWAESGVFNFEGGCYAKCINLSHENEPQIWDAIRFGAVLENTVIDPDNRTIDFASDVLTENTRVAYPCTIFPIAFTLRRSAPQYRNFPDSRRLRRLAAHCQASPNRPCITSCPAILPNSPEPNAASPNRRRPSPPVSARRFCRCIP
jgi:phosphoenolpyruvate carboxykinase (ATP)